MCLLTFFLPCVGICFLRQQAREKYQIDVSRFFYKHTTLKDAQFVFALQGTEFLPEDDMPDMLEDIVLSCCCGCCALAQVAKEAQERAGKPVNVQII